MTQAQPLLYDICIHARSWFFSVALMSVLPFSSQGQDLKIETEELDPRRFLPVGRTVGFESLSSARTGIDFQNQLPDKLASLNQILLNGSGVAVGDFDGDGWEDLYFCRLVGSNSLYRNLGNFRFEDVTEKYGVGLPDQYSTGALWEDFNGDGLVDLLVNGLQAGTKLFLNQGGQGLTLFSGAGLALKTPAYSAAAGDFDQDGDLDLYVTHYQNETMHDRSVQIPLRNEKGRITVAPPYDKRFAVLPDLTGKGQGSIVELGVADQLYENVGGGRFKPVSWTEGAFLDADGNRLQEAPLDWGLAVAFRDINQDGWPDLYVCNDFTSPDRIWINQKNGSFRALPRAALAKTSWSSMAVDFSDINRDGRDDFFVADMLSPDPVRRLTQTGNAQRPVTMEDLQMNRPQVMRNTLFQNRGDGSWAEIASWVGLSASEWTWNAIFCDVDLDGYEDLLIANGHSFDILDADALKAVEGARNAGEIRRAGEPLEYYPDLRIPNLIFRNRGDGRFVDASAEWGWAEETVTHGMALADLDRDGDLDVIFNGLTQPSAIYENQSIRPRIAVELVGLEDNRRAIGSRLEFRIGNQVQSDEIQSGGNYVSGSSTLKVFSFSNENGEGAPEAELRIRWPNGNRSVVRQLRANTRVKIFEPVSKHSSDEQITLNDTEDRSAKKGPVWNFVTQPNPEFDTDKQWQTRPLREPVYPFIGKGNPYREHEVPVWILDWNQDGWLDVGMLNADPEKLQVEIWLNQSGKGFRHLPVALEGLKGSGSQIIQILPPNQQMHDDFKSYSWWVAYRSTDASGQIIWRRFIRKEDTLIAGSSFQSFVGVPGPSIRILHENNESVGVITMLDPRGVDLDSFYVVEENSGDQTWTAQSIELDRKVLGASDLILGDLNNDGELELGVASPWAAVHYFQLQKSLDKDQWIGRAIHDWSSESGWWNALAWVPSNADMENGAVFQWNWGWNLDWDYLQPTSILRLEGSAAGGRSPLALTGYRTSAEQRSTFLWSPYQSAQTVVPTMARLFSSVRDFSTRSMESVGSILKSGGVNWVRILGSDTGSHSGLVATQPKQPIHLPVELNWGPIFDAQSWTSSEGAGAPLTLFLASGHEMGWMDPARQDALRGVTVLYQDLESKEWLWKELPSDFEDPLKPTRSLIPVDFNRDGTPDLLRVGQDGSLDWAVGEGG